VSSVTIKHTVGSIDEHRKRVLVDRITQLVAEHLDEPAQVQVRIRSQDPSLPAPAQASAALGGGGGSGATVVRLCAPVRQGRFGRKMPA